MTDLVEPNTTAPPRASDGTSPAQGARPAVTVTVDAGGVVIGWSPAAQQLLGWTEAEVVGRVLPVAPDSSAGYRELCEGAQGGASSVIDSVCRVRDGAAMAVQLSALPVAGSSGDIERVLLLIEDRSDRRRDDALRTGLQHVLEMLATDAPLPELLTELVRIVEQHSCSGVLGSILVLDANDRLREGAAPSLPAAYNAEIDGLAIGADVGSCGTAAFTRQTVLATDLRTDPRWRAFKDLAETHGLRACWSTPIFSRQGAVLGTFAMYYRTPRAPDPDDLALVETVTRTAMLAIESRQARAAVQRRAAQFETLIGHAPLGIYLIDAALRIAAVNPVARPVFGNIPDLVGRDFVAVVHQLWPRDYADEVIARFRETLATGKPHHVPEQAGTRRDSGAVEHYEWQIARITLPDGDLGVVCYFRDISTLVEGRNALARLGEAAGRQARLYNAILSSVPDLVYVFDLEHRFTYANDVLLRLWGRTWEDAIGKTCLELGYEPWHAEMHDREIEQVKATRAPIRGEVPFTGTSGRRIYDYIFVPVFGPDGEVEAIAGTTRDVTERKQAEDEAGALLAQEQHRATLLSRVADASRTITASLSADSAVRVLAEEARAIIGAHQAVASLTVSDDGTRAISAVSASGNDMRGHDDAAALDRSGTTAEVCRTNRPLRMTQAELAGHGAVRDLLAAPLVGFGGRNLGLVQLSDKVDGEFTADDEAILVQLAAIASAALENARLYDELRDHDRRKDEFLATLAHELRNPLAPIRTGLAVLRRTPTGDTAERTHAVLDRQVAHMVRLVDDLLDVSRITSGKIELRRERVDVREVFAAAVELSRPGLDGAGHHLTVACPDDALPVEVDPTRMAQVVGNLLNNAAKYTPPGGHVVLAAERDGDEVVVRVQDDGIGLEPDTLERVFDLFSQVGAPAGHGQGGLGIGLALVRRLVTMHGGSVGAESDGPGRGAAFVVRLPLAGAMADEAAPAAPVQALAQSPAHRILVVDDNVDAAETLALVLQLDGHATRTVHTGPEVADAARRFAPDIVFLDIGLPGMNGYEVARQLRGDPALGATMLVALTGWGTEHDARRAIDSGFDSHLTKPADIEQVRRLVATAVCGRAPPNATRH